MQLMSKFNKGFRFLLCVLDIFSKYAWLVSLKDKKGVSLLKDYMFLVSKNVNIMNTTIHIK